MKTRFLATTLFAATAATVLLFPVLRDLDAGTIAPPPVQGGIENQRPRIDVAFVLDTTGSMSGLIETAKEKIWSIASTMAQAEPAPYIRVGLVGYRDRGDAYVTKIVDLSADLDSVYAKLMDFRADGGGDGPESVNQALHEAVNELAWNREQGTYRVVFLVGDAPPHMDYGNDIRYPETLATARENGIVVNTVQCGSNSRTERDWRRIAGLGQGKYFQVEQAGGAVAIATPYDASLAELSAKLDATRMYYGTEEEKAKYRAKKESADKLHASASVASKARRATFNATESGKANLLGEGELVDAVASGRKSLAEIDEDQLPEPLQAAAPEARQAIIEKTAARRDELKSQIQELADRREKFLAKKVEEEGGARDSLDEKIYSAVREQSAEVGMSYGSDSARY